MTDRDWRNAQICHPSLNKDTCSLELDHYYWVVQSVGTLYKRKLKNIWVLLCYSFQTNQNKKLWQTDEPYPLTTKTTLFTLSSIGPNDLPANSYCQVEAIQQRFLLKVASYPLFSILLHDGHREEFQILSLRFCRLKKERTVSFLTRHSFRSPNPYLLAHCLLFLQNL